LPLVRPHDPDLLDGLAEAREETGLTDVRALDDATARRPVQVVALRELLRRVRRLVSR
jgi:hypothetical protein